MTTSKRRRRRGQEENSSDESQLENKSEPVMATERELPQYPPLQVDVEAAKRANPYLTEEELSDPYHPNNDQFVINVVKLQLTIAEHSSSMPPMHVEALKRLHAQPQPYPKIAEALGIGVGTIQAAVRSEKGQRLLALLNHYAAQQTGSSKSQRANMLWRIAKNTEQDRPSIAISAVSELNRMEVVTHTQQIQAEDRGEGAVDRRPKVTFIPRIGGKKSEKKDEDD